jgi:hypothetical protein
MPPPRTQPKKEEEIIILIGPFMFRFQLAFILFKWTFSPNNG